MAFMFFSHSLQSSVFWSLDSSDASLIDRSALGGGAGSSSASPAGACRAFFAGDCPMSS
jgi:hypothetical protein